ncbi:DUF2341 domain-containing protein [Patescibacteria group bacterium]|nr:DUF2341 domain-containing protein [Patescibacteria group bacterium]
MIQKILKKFITILSIFGLLFLSILPAFTNVWAARITPLSDTMSNQTVSASATNNFSFDAVSGIPASGTITLTFPSGFTNVSISSATSSMSGATFAVSGNVITITNGSTAVPSGTIVTLSNIIATNPSSVSSLTTQYIITLSDSGGDQASLGVAIVASSTYGSGPSGDLYSQAITINSTNTSTLTNYQVEVTLNTSALITAGQMEADCADLRFTDSSGNLLPYWIESGCNTTTTQIWVKVPTITASANTTIYLYYGALNAAPESNIHNTFIFGSQFNTLNSQIWGTNNNVSLSSGNGVLVQDNGTQSELYTKSPWPSQAGEVIGLETSILNSGGFRQRYYPINQEDGGTGCIGSATCIQTSPLSGNADMGIFYSGSALNPYFDGYQNVTLSNNTWYKSDYILTGTNLQWIFKSSSGSTLFNGSYGMAYNTSQIQYIIFRATESSTSAMYIKYMYVRQYSSPEPTTSVSATVTDLTNNQLQLEVGVSPFITFSISSNSLNIGTLSPTSVSSTSNSLTLSSNASNGSNISVFDVNAGLYNTADSHKIASSTATLSAGSEGYGINASTTYSGLNIQYPYNGTGDSVGALLSSASSILCSDTTTVNVASITVNYLASISNITPSGPYSDTVTFIATGNF